MILTTHFKRKKLQQVRSKRPLRHCSLQEADSVLLLFDGDTPGLEAGIRLLLRELEQKHIRTEGICLDLNRKVPAGKWLDENGGLFRLRRRHLNVFGYPRLRKFTELDRMVRTEYDLVLDLTRNDSYAAAVLLSASAARMKAGLARTPFRWQPDPCGIRFAVPHPVSGPAVQSPGAADTGSTGTGFPEVARQVLHYLYTIRSGGNKQ